MLAETQLVSTRWGERSDSARARSSLLGLPLESRSAVLLKGIFGLADLVGVALRGLRCGLLDGGVTKSSVSADSFLSIGGVAIEMKDFSGSSWFFGTEAPWGLLLGIFREPFSDSRLHGEGPKRSILESVGSASVLTLSDVSLMVETEIWSRLRGPFIASSFDGVT